MQNRISKKSGKTWYINNAITSKSLLSTHFQGWKGSVKARHFVLALHDYYTDKPSNVGSETPTVDRGSQGSMSPSPALSPRPPKSGNSIMFRRQDDKWALAYINAAYVQPILEAVDDDGTGFVSVKEVNTFVASRPDGWR